MSKKPVAYIIAGPNGSGKTTFATEFLPKMVGCFDFVNADMVAKGLSPFAPGHVALQAGKLVLRRVRDLSREGVTFGFETTLAGRTYVRFVKDMKTRGYEIRVYFLWIRSVELALRRIRDRVSRGGHDVPEADVRRRYASGLRNLFTLYRPFADFVAILDNSGESPGLVACGNATRLQLLKPRIMAEIGREAKVWIPGVEQ